MRNEFIHRSQLRVDLFERFVRIGLQRIKSSGPGFFREMIHRADAIFVTRSEVVVFHSRIADAEQHRIGVLSGPDGFQQIAFA